MFWIILTWSFVWDDCGFWIEIKWTILLTNGGTRASCKKNSWTIEFLPHSKQCVSITSTRRSVVLLWESLETHKHTVWRNCRFIYCEIGDTNSFLSTSLFKTQKFCYVFPLALSLPQARHKFAKRKHSVYVILLKKCCLSFLTSIKFVNCKLMFLLKHFMTFITYGCLSLVSVVCCQVERLVRLADPSSRGVLPTVVCQLCVISTPQKWVGPGPRWDVVREEKNNLNIDLRVA